MDIKLIALDMDGTLLMDDHITISERNRQAVKAAHDRGIKIVIASGRTYTWLADIRAQVPFVDYTLTSNGAAAVDVKTEKTIFQEGIPYEQWVPIYDIMKKYDVLFEIYADGCSHMEEIFFDRYGNEDVPAEAVEYMKSMIHPLKDGRVDLKGKSIEKMACLAPDTPEFAAMEKEIRNLGNLALSSGLPGNLEINHGRANKGNALAGLCRQLGIEAGEVMAFGDSTNDLEMLAFAGNSYAMVNAIPQVKEAAKYQAPSNMEDGVAQVIEKFLTDIDK